MKEQLTDIHQIALQELNQMTSLEVLAQWRQKFLSKKGEFSLVLKGLGKLSAAERPVMGQLANQLKQDLEHSFLSKQQQLEEEALELQLAQETIDVSLPGRTRRRGRLHLCTQMLRQIYQIFAEMGFQLYESPEVESDEYNFQLLNIPKYHPARDMWDTFWLKNNLVLRTHTSPGQIRVMREHHPHPIRVILPGKVYRYEHITSRSEHQFYQVEGLAIGKKISMTDLIGVMQEASKKIYGSDRQVRIRGSYFPFTEPSIEIDISCFCNGAGCRICKKTGWLEVGGAGMTHPTVLKNGGYNPKEWNAFAFGMGVERPAMLKYHIPDIRYFYANHPHFLKQF